MPDPTTGPTPRHYVLRQPAMAPFGVLLDESAVQEVWDTFVKPGQDRGEPQSIEDRMLMAILRHVHAAMTGRELDPEKIAKAIAASDGIDWDHYLTGALDLATDYRANGAAVVAALTGDVAK